MSDDFELGGEDETAANHYFYCRLIYQLFFLLIYLLFSHRLINYLVKLSINDNSKFCY